MLSTAQADPTPWLPLPEAADWLEGDAPAGTERASKYYRARYYDPGIGRFISEDPIGFRAGVNFYAYVANNPVTRTDPSGLIGFGGGGGLTGGVIIIPPTPIAPPLVGIFDVDCFVVGDLRGNIGVLCCGGLGLGAGGVGVVSPQGGAVICPTCPTICDMEGPYFQFQGAGAAGPGAAAGGGAASSAAGVTLMATVGPAAGLGGYGGFTIGMCKIVWQNKWPGQCKCN